MIGAIVLIGMAIVTAILAFIVAWRYRGQSLYIDWSAFAAMGLGSLAIGAFYVAVAESIWRDHNLLELAPYSRFVWGFVLLSTALMAVFVLKGNGKADE